MSIYHKDKCTESEIKEFRQKVVNFLDSMGIKPYRIKAFRSYNGEVRLYKAEPALRLRQRRGRKFVAFKNPDGTYEGESTEAIEILKSLVVTSFINTRTIQYPVQIIHKYSVLTNGQQKKGNNRFL